MKRARALGIGLKLLGLAFSIGPLLIAFSINGWDVQATLFNTEEFQPLEGETAGFFGEGEGAGVEIDQAGVEYDNITKIVRVPVTISLPMNFSIDLTEFTLSGIVDGQSINLTMEEEKVKLVPGENALIHLIGTVGVDPTSKEIQSTTGTITLEKSGVTIQLVIEEGGL